MATAKKTWVEKLHDSKDLPKVVKMNAKGAKHWGREMLAIPAPLEVDGLMKKVPAGKITTIVEIRNKIAKKHKADCGCPLTTGIFTWIAANAAEEEKEAGKKNITPYWRTLKSGGEINPKYPGGINAQKKLLRNEGHKIVSKGEKIMVSDWQETLYNF